jgi:hypothetical protein
MIAQIINSYSLVLDDLRKLVADIPDDRLAKQAGGAVNHPAWIIGHLVHSAQAIGGEMGLSPWLASDWAGKFATGTIPRDHRNFYPSKLELLDALQDSQQRITQRLLALGEAGLSQPLPDERYRAMFPTLGHAVLHILTVHAAIHVGQITVWRRAIGLGPLRENFM